MPLSTEKLVRLAQSGSKDAFIELMEAHKTSMMRAGMAVLHDPEDTADAISETVLEAFSQLCGLRQPRYFKTWLTRVLISNCCDILRQRRRYVPMEQLPEGPGPGGQPSDEALDIRESLSALAKNDRLVLTLYYVDGFKVREIAQMLDVKESTVKSRLMRSRKKLKKIYLEREGDPCETK